MINLKLLAGLGPARRLVAGAVIGWGVPQFSASRPFVVTGSGCSRYCAPGRGSRLPRNLQVSLSLAVGACVWLALVDTSKTVEGGTST